MFLKSFNWKKATISRKKGSFLSGDKGRVQKKYEIQQMTKKARNYVQQWVHKIERFHNFFPFCNAFKRTPFGQEGCGTNTDGEDTIRKSLWRRCFALLLFYDEKGGKEWLLCLQFRKLFFAGFILTSVSSLRREILFFWKSNTSVGKGLFICFYHNIANEIIWNSRFDKLFICFIF